MAIWLLPIVNVDIVMMIEVSDQTGVFFVIYGTPKFFGTFCTCCLFFVFVHCVLPGLISLRAFRLSPIC